RLGVRLVATKRALGDLGAGGKIAFWGALAYTILPIDLLPDPIYLDDMGVLGLALLYLTNLLRKRSARRSGGATPAQRPPRPPAVRNR
ncbi:MAG: DUF1232 domain-containing protein, partial [Hamadaea sp.]|nr:DUF1232 domain-containing protein [Hamadaea sp.]